ncbi:MAG: family 78 glycoside hydrolase catalytic domain [Polyangiaceae bacterium]|nr:family 78 glycoside hydrolase catalytic domain [Polyangiaceae bacterium]
MPSQTSSTPFDLTCEYTTNPLGLHTQAPRFAWCVGAPQVAYRVRVASSAQLLESGASDKWDSGWVVSNRTTHVTYGGSALVSREECWWQVHVKDAAGVESVSSAATFEMGLLSEAEWEADWVGAPGIWPGRALFFRHAFQPKAKVRRARLYIAGLGLYRAYLNGNPISDRVLDPPPTDFEQIVPYTVHDIAHLIESPETVLSVVVGHGWYGRPILKLRLEVECVDGSRITTPSHWDMSTFAVRASATTDGLFRGEDHDARLELKRWSVPAADWKAPFGNREDYWTMVYRVPGPGGRLVPDLGEPMRVVEESTPKKLLTLPNGADVFDAGTNMTGYCRLKLNVPEGHKVTLRFGETRKEDGSVNQDNLYAARCADVYIARGGGQEVWEPRFTYHGFRYIEVEGLGNAGPEALTVCRVRNDIPERGVFTSSNDMANAIHQMIVRTEKSNELGVLTDCPQRSERQGWLNDQTARAEQLVHNFQAVRFLAKWLRDFASVQDPVTGAIPDTVPWHWGKKRADPVCVCPVWYPYLMWRHYGDRNILNEYWSMMVGWQRCLANESEGGILESSWYGDWCPPRAFSMAALPTIVGTGSPCLSAGTPGGLISTAHLIFITRLLEKIARELGKVGEADVYALEAERFTHALQAKYFNESTHTFGENVQACNALALWMDLVPEQHRPGVFQRLTADVEARGHLTTGNVCTKYLLEVLTDLGRADLAWALVQRKEYPSWGYMLENGATTMWERWENETGGGMNSHNHCMLGAVDAWFYSRLVGILDDPSAEPGDAFVVRPHPVPGLDTAKATLKTIRGELSVEWLKQGTEVVVHVRLPVGARAKLTAPAGWKLAAGTNASISENVWQGALVPA